MAADRPRRRDRSCADRRHLRGEPRSRPRSADERETDPDADEEPGAARRGEPGRRVVLAAAVRHAGRRHAAWWPAGPSAAGLLVRDRWGMEGVKPPPPVRLKDYSVALPAEPARAWSSSARSPSEAEDFASQGGGAPGPRGPGVQDGQGRARRDGGRPGRRPVHHQGGRGRHQAERRLRQEPRPRRHHPARHRSPPSSSSASAPARAR